MKRGVAFLDRDKNSTACRANFAASGQRAFYRRPVARRFDNPGGQKDRIARRRRPEQFNRVLGRHGARHFLRIGFLHQVISRGPVAVTIQQRSDDPAVQNAGECFVLLLRLPLRNDFIALSKAANMQSIRIGGTTTKASVVRRVRFLK